MGREGRAGSLCGVGGGKPQLGVGKHCCWASSRESCWEHGVLPRPDPRQGTESHHGHPQGSPAG